MVDANTTVGCAVGIPAGVILICFLLFWLRNQHKQKKEDIEQQALDKEILDNTSYIDMQQELVAMRNTPQGPGGIQKGQFDEKTKSSTNEETTETQEISSSNDRNSSLTYDNNNNQREICKSKPILENKQSFGHSEILYAPNSDECVSVSHSSSSVADTTTTATNNTPSKNRIVPRGTQKSHSKTPSAFSFYDNVIPVLQEQGPPNANMVVSPPSKNSSVNSLAGLGSVLGVSSPSVPAPESNRSLDNLAKQLSQPSYFEKLPKVASPGFQRKSEAPSRQSSSVDLHSGVGSSAPIGKVLGGQYDNSFKEPFSEQGGVVYK